MIHKYNWLTSICTSGLGLASLHVETHATGLSKFRLVAFLRSQVPKGCIHFFLSCKWNSSAVASLNYWDKFGLVHKFLELQLTAISPSRRVSDRSDGLVDASDCGLLGPHALHLGTWRFKVPKQGEFHPAGTKAFLGSGRWRD